MKYFKKSLALALVSMVSTLAQGTRAAVDFYLVNKPVSGQSNTAATSLAYAAVGPSGAIASGTAQSSNQATKFRLIADGTVQTVDSAQCVSSVSLGPSGSLAATQCQASSQVNQPTKEKFTIYYGQLVPLDGRCLQVINGQFICTTDCSSASAGASAGAYVKIISGTVSPPYGYQFGYADGYAAASFGEKTVRGDSALKGTLRAVSTNRTEATNSSSAIFKNDAEKGNMGSSVTTIALSAMIVMAIL